MTHATTRPARPQQFDAQQCRSFIKLLHAPGAVYEIRCPNTQRGTVSGYFNDLECAVQAVGQWSGKAAVYVTMNPLNPALLARSNNRLMQHAKQTTSDNDIVRRRWLLVDVDACRPSGISATESEKDAALDLARQLRNWLAAQCWPEPILADSGNGGHLLYHIDLPNDPDSLALVENCLKALAFHFDGERVRVDTGIGNAARICKLYGSMACKGDSMADRPHRLASILEKPETCEPIALELLHHLAAQLPPVSLPAHCAKNGQYSGQPFDLEHWIAAHGLPVKRSGVWHGGRRWILDPCPWNSEHTGGSAYVVQLPGGPIAAGCHHNSCRGFGWEQLRENYDPRAERLAVSTRRQAPAAPVQERREGQGSDASPAPSHFYQTRDGCLGYMKKLGRGDDATEIFSPLCNFTAQVVEERALDDGLEVKRRFLIEGRLADGHRLPGVEVSAAQFAAMRWPVDLWGVRARICAGLGAQDRLREAIQVFSAGAQVRHAYSHTGWRKIDGTWRYLHAGLTDIEVLLEPPLNRYALPEKADDVAAALRVSLALLDAGPDEVTIPLLSAVYLSVLCEFLRPDFVLFLLGRTGSLKSTLAALFLSHFGNFPDKNALPASWESTDNAIEKRLFTLKDVPCVVDDYAPRADAHAQRQQAQRTQRIIRSMGNLSGRSRLRSDLSGRPDYAPRGLMLSTGEDLPPGQSILARILSVEVDRSRLHLPKITEAQRQARRLRHAMAGYIAWPSPQLDDLSSALPEQWREHRANFTEKAAHLRTPEILAYLALGIDLVFSFARDLGVLSELEIEGLARRTHGALHRVGEIHGHRVREEDPAEIFLSTIGAMLAQGAVALAPRDSPAGVANLIGWRDSEYAFVIPEATHNAVGRFLRDGGGHFPYSARALNKALDARGALVRGQDGKGPRLVKISGKARRVLQIPISLLEPEEEVGEAVTRTVTPE